jgi:Amt family ammonium transporter
MSRVFLHHIDIDAVLNGSIAGLASITSGASLMEPYLGLITGMVGGGCYFGFGHFLNWVRVDDPLQASAVHFAGGVWALFSTGLFASSRNIVLTYGFQPTAFGLFVGGGWEQLGIQCLEILCIVAWTSVWALVIFLPFKWCRLLRVTTDVENAGLDQSLHGDCSASQPECCFGSNS